MAAVMTLAQFQEWFDAQFAEHDADKDGRYNLDESLSFGAAMHALKADGSDFDGDKVKAMFEGAAEDGHVTKEKVQAAVLKRMQENGKVEA